jgi:GTPase SAR1 family protein
MAKEPNMSLIATAGKPADRPILVTLCGDAGMGKTSLAAAFPKPIFIRVEDGMQAIPSDKRPDAFPMIGNSKTLWEQLGAVIHEPHDYQTLVIDLP